MNTINEFRRKRLDLAMAAVGIHEAEYKPCANPDWVTVTFKHPDMKPGYAMTGSTFFDFRRQYTQALHHRGFQMECDNQGYNPFGLSVRDWLPEDLDDGEILSLDNDGCLIQWNGEDFIIYNCGETPEEFGLHNIRENEMARIKPSMDARDYLAKAIEAVAA